MNLMNHLFQQMKINLLLNENHHLQKTFFTEWKKNHLNFLIWNIFSFHKLKALKPTGTIKEVKLAHCSSTNFIFFSLLHNGIGTIPKAYFLSIDGIELKYYPCIMKGRILICMKYFCILSYCMLLGGKYVYYTFHYLIEMRIPFFSWIWIWFNFLLRSAESYIFRVQFSHVKIDIIRIFFLFLGKKINLPFVK